MILAKRKQLAIAYRNVFESPDGARVLADLKKHCPQLTSSAHLLGALDANRLFVQEGQRSVLTYIYTMLRRDPNEDRPEQALNERQGE